MQQNQPVTPESGAYRIQIAGPDLQFRDAKIADPVPTGRQIIEAAGGRPPDDFVVLQWPDDGDMLAIDLDQTTDLRAPGAERFIVAKSDRIYLFEIDGKRHGWPEPVITREALLAIAKQDPSKFSVWQEFQKRPDEEILAGHPANLDAKGTERFYTVMKHTTEGGQ
jgi:hypothetical protein